MYTVTVLTHDTVTCENNRSLTRVVHVVVRPAVSPDFGVR